MRTHSDETPPRRTRRGRMLSIAALSLAIGLGVPATAPALDAEAFRAGYRKVLGSWARGEESVAIADLLALERAGAPRATEGELDDLFRAKLRVVRDLLDDSAEVLVPVILLHHDAYLGHRDQRNFPLAAHSRRMTEELVDVYAARAGSEGARITSARILTSLAGHLLNSGMTGAAVQNFNRALDLDPRDAPALLSMAVLAEKIGRTEEAGVLLDRLLAIQPSHAEGSLRRAVVARRLGQTADAERLFKRLAAQGAGEPPGWVAELAVQELARLYADTDRAGAAQTLLRDALPRFPESQRMRLVLAYLEDRAGRTGVARATAAEVMTIPPTPEVTPRLRYNAYPQDELQAVRRSMVEALAARRALLARTLGATEAAGGSR